MRTNQLQVGSVEIVDLSIDTIDIKDDAVTPPKLDETQDYAMNKLVVGGTAPIGAEAVRVAGGELRVESQILAADGSLADCGFQFLTASNIGLYRPVANTLGIVVNGIEQVRISISKIDLNQDTEVVGDIEAVGGFKVSMAWWRNNLPASQANLIIQRAKLLNRAYPIFAGSLLGMVIASSAVVTAGTIDATIYKNGVATALTVQLNTTDSQYKIATVSKDTIIFSPGDYLECWVDTSADLSPANTNNIIVELIVEE